MKMLIKALYDMKIKCKIAHRDLKPGNIILENDGKSYLITDFGCSKIMNSKDDLILRGFAGTPGYLAPEVEFNCGKS